MTTQTRVVQITKINDDFEVSTVHEFDPAEKGRGYSNWDTAVFFMDTVVAEEYDHGFCDAARSHQKLADKVKAFNGDNSGDYAFNADELENIAKVLDKLAADRQLEARDFKERAQHVWESARLLNNEL